MQNWYAPSLSDNAEAGVGDWPEREIVALLKTGVSARGSVQGPMAEVVARSDAVPERRRPRGDGGVPAGACRDGRRRAAPRDRRQRRRADARASAGAKLYNDALRRLPRRATAKASPAPIRRSPAIAR